MNNNKGVILNVKRKYEKAVQSWVDEVPKIAIKFFQSSFTNGGFTDTTLVRWKKRKIDRPYPILMRTKRLRNSIKMMGRTKYSVSIGTELNYAKYHNNGTGRLPKRQFIGESTKLTRILTDLLNKKIRNIR